MLSSNRGLRSVGSPIGVYLRYLRLEYRQGSSQVIREFLLCLPGLSSPRYASTVITGSAAISSRNTRVARQSSSL